MPFGFINPLANFQNLMNNVICKFLDNFVLSYIDNMFVNPKSIEMYKEYVKLVL